MPTKDNLQAAFAGESQANRKYLAFAKKAEADGFPQVARLFRAVAEAETIHAHAHLRAMGGVHATADNLKAAIDGEKYEFTEMYPAFIKEAEAEGEKQAVRSMTHANEVEKVHHDLFTKALQAVESGKDLADLPVYVCPVCGHTEIGTPPDNCPICNVKGERFSTIN
ncbi:MAG: rubrerythrin family protein [Magnetococcales bacterium]|nr:rubrerythrin family protein [Magnetococcales bacterium]